MESSHYEDKESWKDDLMKNYSIVFGTIFAG